MALTIEDGSGVVGADSYATVAELQDYAQKRAITVPGDVTECEVLLRKACDYIQAQESRFKGRRTNPTQTLAWPRYRVFVDRFFYPLPFDKIPPELKAGQIQAAIEVQSLDLMPTIDPATQRGAVIEKTVDVLTTKYAEPLRLSALPTFTKVDGLLTRLYAVGSNQVPLVRA